MHSYKEAKSYYDQSLNLIIILLNVQSSKGKKKANLSYSYHYKLEQTLGFLVILLQNMSIFHELQDNFAKCFESMRLSYWVSKSYFDFEDDLTKFIKEQFQSICEKVSCFLIS